MGVAPGASQILTISLIWALVAASISGAYAAPPAAPGSDVSGWRARPASHLAPGRVA
jgi:hypothetical protein